MSRSKRDGRPLLILVPNNRRSLSKLLDVGKKVDLTVFDAPNCQYLMYCFGTNLAEDT